MVVSSVNSTLSEYESYLSLFRNHFCQLEMSDDYPPLLILPVGTWYTAVYFTIQGDSDVSPILLSTPTMCLQGLFETFQNACYVPGGRCYYQRVIFVQISFLRWHSDAFLFPNITKCRDPVGVVESRWGARQWGRYVVTLWVRESSLERLLGRTEHLPCMNMIQKPYRSA